MGEMTEEQRGRVHPLRGDRVTLPDGAEGLARIRTLWEESGAYWRRGVKRAKAPHAERMGVVVAAIDGHPGRARDPDTEATLMVMLDYWSRRAFETCDGHANERYAPVDAWFVRRWIDAGGLPFALRVLEAFPRLDVDDSGAGTADKHALAIKTRDGYAWWCLEQGHLGLLHTVRRFVVASGDADYAAARAEAAKIRKDAPVWLRAGLAFVFPDEPFHVEDLAALRGPKVLPHASWGLVTTRLDDRAALAEILDSMRRDDQSWTSGTEHYGLSLVHRLGEDAAPLLVGYLEAVRAKSAKLAFQEALALLDSKLQPKPKAKPESKAKAKPKPKTKPKAKPKKRA